MYKQRAQQINKTLKLHVYGSNDQSAFLRNFDLSQLILNMAKNVKKQKNLTSFTERVERYHFYFVDMMLDHLIKDQQKDAEPKLQTIIRLNQDFKIEVQEDEEEEGYDDGEAQSQLYGAIHDVKSDEDPFADDDNNAAGDAYEPRQLIRLELQDEKHHRTGRYAHLQGTNNLGNFPNPVYERMQKKECNKLLFFEIRVFEFLFKSLGSLMANMRSIVSQWARGVGLETNDVNPLDPNAAEHPPEEAKRAPAKKDAQAQKNPDLITKTYLQSLVNLLEVERRVLNLFRRQQCKIISNQVAKQLTKYDGQARELVADYERTKKQEMAAEARARDPASASERASSHREAGK